jgi:hypothetical protein
MIRMMREKLPCADPQCTDIMRLVFQNERFIGYRCLLKPNTHNFRYNIDRNLWEKIIIKAKPIICYKECPYDILVEEDFTIESI